MQTENQYFNRDLSWLSFNHRVLQEAENKEVPLMERLKFLAIFSSNLDEFFRVRVASIRSLAKVKKKLQDKLDFEPEALLDIIADKVQQQQEIFGKTFRESILPELERYGVSITQGEDLNATELLVAENYFINAVQPHLELSYFDEDSKAPFLKNKALYLVLQLSEGFATVEIPSDKVSRFYQLPVQNGQHRIMYLDDLIRLFLSNFVKGKEILECHSIKVSRDAELYLEDEYSGNLVQKIRRSLSKRDTGVPTRVLYDPAMPADMLKVLEEKLALEDDTLIEGARYHNFNDFFGFPNPERKVPEFEKMKPQPHVELEATDSVIDLVSRRDVVLNFPYQKYDYVSRFIEEASVDPDVRSIKITLYRVASDSKVVKALINAVKNGKQVIAFFEVKARFDEASNLFWAEELEKVGATVLYSMPGLKVHTKLCTVDREEAGQIKTYAFIATGNFNEKTARIYTDIGLFTANPLLTKDSTTVFQYLNGEIEAPEYEHLLVAPNHMRKEFYRFIDREIAHARAGKRGYILAKMNSLEDRKMIDKLYEANRAGVKIDLIIRGMCCLVPGVEGLSEHITVRSIVGRFLEHARVYLFHNDGADDMYVASADWMKRNLSRRVEIAFPVYDEEIKKELLELMQLQLNDNVKARIIDKLQQNKMVASDGVSINAQTAAYQFLNPIAKSYRLT